MTAIWIAPSEANRDKHINFTALGKNESDPADALSTGKLADKEEKKNRKTTNPKQDEEEF